MSDNQRDEQKLEGLKKLKGLKILNFLLFFARSKIGFKFLEDKEHFTIKFLPEGIIDIHQTIEGKEKRYPKAWKFNMKELVDTIKETYEQELPKILKEIDITDPKYEDVEVFVMPEKEVIRKTIEPFKVKKRKITIDGNNFNDLFSIAFMRDLPNYDFQVAFWGEESEEQALYRVDGRYFVLKIEDFTKLLDKMREKLNIRDFG